MLLKKNFQNNIYIKGFLQIFSSQGLSQFLLFLSLLILGALYKPSDFGIYGAISSVTIFFITVSGLSLEMSLLNAPGPQKASEILLTCFFTNSLISCLTIIIAAALINFNVFNLASLPMYLPIVIGLLVFSGGTYQALRFRLLYDKKFYDASIALISQSAGRSIFPILFFLYLTNYLGLMLGELVGRLFGIYKGLTIYWKELLDIINTKGLISTVRETIQENKKFPTFFLPISIIDSLGIMLIAPLILYFYSEEEAGLFYFGNIILISPSIVLGNALGDILHVKFAELVREKSAELFLYFIKISIFIAFISLTLFTIIVLVFDMFIVQLLSPDWINISLIVKYLAPYGAIGLVVTCFSRLLSILVRPGIKIFSDLSKFFFIPFWIIYAGFSDLTFLSCMKVLGVTLGTIYLIYYLLILLSIYKQSNLYKND